MAGGKIVIKFNADQAKTDKIPGKPRILVAPLDWGLGHASRCIPLIRELIRQDCDVWLAAEGATAKLLQLEFPDLALLSLTGYYIEYSRSTRGFLWKIMRQFSQIRAAIRHENKWLKRQMKHYEFDAVISDNRFGLFSPNLRTIFITHQLIIKTSLGKWFDSILQRWNYRYINRFSECWVPDLPNENNVAGQLSHPDKLPAIPIRYLGILSRFQKEAANEKKGYLVIVLSGPEPQRTILENKLIDDLVHYNGTADVIRGLPHSDMILPSTNHIRFYNHLSSAELNKKIAEAEFVISRTGYSTVMDLIQLQKRSILIPTPGQTEQGYLAKYLQQKKIAFCVQQDDFSLLPAMENARNFSYHFITVDNNLLNSAVQAFVAELKK